MPWAPALWDYPVSSEEILQGHLYQEVPAGGCGGGRWAQPPDDGRGPLTRCRVWEEDGMEAVMGVQRDGISNVLPGGTEAAGNQEPQLEQKTVCSGLGGDR